jgi:hypothetical protein
MLTAQFFNFNKPKKFITSGGLGTMGFGLPASIGAQIANPTNLVLNITGDGSFQMNLQELATCREHNIPVKIIIMNNGYLGMVRQMQDKIYNNRYQVEMINPDFTKIAEAYDLFALRVNKSDELIPALEKINPSLKDSLNTLAEVATNDNLIIEEYLSTIRNKIINNRIISSPDYKALSSFVKKRFLYEFIQKLELDYDNKRINELYNFIEENITKRNGNTISIATAKWLYVDEKVIETIPHKAETQLVDNSWEIIVDSEGSYKIGDKTLVVKPYVENEIFILIYLQINSHLLL